MLHWIHVDETGLGRPRFAGSPPVNKMSIPMMVICVLNEICEDKDMASQYEGELRWAVNEILNHVQVRRLSVTDKGRSSFSRESRVARRGSRVENFPFGH